MVQIHPPQPTFSISCKPSGNKPRSLCAHTAIMQAEDVQRSAHVRRVSVRDAKSHLRESPTLRLIAVACDEHTPNREPNQAASAPLISRSGEGSCKPSGNKPRSLCAHTAIMQAEDVQRSAHVRRVSVRDAKSHLRESPTLRLIAVACDEHTPNRKPNQAASAR